MGAAGSGALRVTGQPYTIPERELRLELNRAATERILPAYSAFHDRFSGFGFSNPEKHVRCTPQEVEAALQAFYQVHKDREARLTV